MNETVFSLNPATGQEIARFESITNQQLQHVVAQARAAQPAWAGLALDARAAYLMRMLDALHAQADALAECIQHETGKRLPDAQYEIWDHLSASVGGGGGFEICLHEMRALLAGLGDVSHLLPHGVTNTDAMLRYVPHGVIGLIMPWNFPLWIPLVSALPLLLAGNVVIFKPSEYATQTGLAIDQLFKAAELPSGVFQTVVGGKATGQALAEAGLDQLWLTGSVAAGRAVQQAAGLRPVELELGGNSAAIICAEADIDLAVAGVVWGATYNAGQSCSGIKRILVHTAIAETFIARVTDSVRGLVAGRDYGPLIRAEARETIRRRVQQAEADGAQVLTGGETPADLPSAWAGGFWLTPPVVLLKNLDTELVKAETFGNVLPIFIVQDEAEAMRLANATPFGLSASIWSADTGRAHDLANQLEVGMVFINEVELALAYGEHWRGWKQSSIAGAGSKLARCFKQQLHIRYTGSVPRPYWYPY